MNDFANYSEYSVKRKNDSALIFRKFLLIFLYVIYVVVFLILCFKTGLFPLGALIPLTLWIIVFFSWKYTSVEYEYIISSGTLTVSVIYGNKTRKNLVEQKIKDMSVIAPYDERGKSNLERINPQILIYSLSSKDSPNAYYAVFESSSSKKSSVLFDASSQMLKIMRFYNSSTVIKTENGN